MVLSGEGLASESGVGRGSFVWGRGVHRRDKGWRVP